MPSQLTAGAPRATTSIEGIIKLSGDLGGTSSSPTVLSVHLTGPLPPAQGGTGANLSSSGGTNQFVKQLTAGGAFTVATITAADLPESAAVDSAYCLAQSAPFQYVDSIYGNDSNSGCSWGHAKQYVKTAWIAIYNAVGLASRTHGGGVIYMNDGGGPVLWDAGGNRAAIIGPNDPNWGSCSASPCTINGISYVIQAPMNLVGYGNGLAQSGVSGRTPAFCDFGLNDTNNPTIGLHITGTDTFMTFDGLCLLNTDIPVAVALDSNGATGSSDNTAGLLFENFIFLPRDGCGGTPLSGHRSGPGVLLGYVFEIYFRDGTISGCSGQSSWAISSVTRDSNVSTYQTATPHNLKMGDAVFVSGVTDATFNVTAYRVSNLPDTTHFSVVQNGPNATSSGGAAFGPGSAAVLADPAGGFGPGLLTFSNVHFNAGGIKYTGTAGGSGVFIDEDSLTESQASFDAILWMASFNFAGQNAGPIHAFAADAGGGNSAVRIASGAGPTQTVLPGLVYPGINSCGTSYGMGQLCPGTQGSSGPETSGGTGFIADKIFGRYDDWRHGGLYQHYYANQVSTSPGSWSGTTVTGTPGPFAIQSSGDTSAGKVTDNTVTFGSITTTLHNGDWVIAKGMWNYETVVNASALAHPWKLVLSGGGCTAQLVDPRDNNVMSQPTIGIGFGQTYVSIGSWEVSGGLFQVYSPAGSSTCTMTFFGSAVGNGPSNGTIAYYNPTLQLVPAADLNIQAVSEMAMYEPPFPSTMTVLTVSPISPNPVVLPNSFVLAGATPTVSSGQVGLGTSTSATATAGSATLPANPVGFLEINIGGTMVKVPYYAT